MTGIGEGDRVTKLTHIDERGDAHMVEVGDKPITARFAVAGGEISVGPAALAAIREHKAAKGDVLAVAQLAGIMAAKRASDLIPLCHPIPLSGVDVHLWLDEPRSVVVCEASASAHWRTGVEMEALVAVSAALLTVYDMCKAVDRSMVVGGVRLLEKRGGRSGEFRAEGR